MSSSFHFLLLRCALVLLLASTLVSCGKPLRLQVVLGKEEQVTKGQQVLVDGQAAGEVVNLGQEGGERVANLVIRDPEARKRLKVGSVRVLADGIVDIKTDTAKANAALLAHGSRVPTTSELGRVVRKYSNMSTLMAVGGAVVVLLLIWFLFKSLLGTVGLIFCGVLAALMAHSLHVHADPWVNAGLDWVASKTEAVRAVNEGGPQPDPATAPAQNVKPATDNEQRNAPETGILEITSRRPSPLVLSWCLMFIFCFVGCNLVMGRAAKIWK